MANLPVSPVNGRFKTSSDRSLNLKYRQNAYVQLCYTLAYILLDLISYMYKPTCLVDDWQLQTDY